MLAHFRLRVRVGELAWVVEVDVDVQFGLDDDVDDSPPRDAGIDVHGVADTKDLVPLWVESDLARIIRIILEPMYVKEDAEMTEGCAGAPS